MATEPTAAMVLAYLRKMNHHTMQEICVELDKTPLMELHNLISKTNVLRALSSMAIQDQKFPIPK